MALNKEQAQQKVKEILDLALSLAHIIVRKYDGKIRT